MLAKGQIERLIEFDQIYTSPCQAVPMAKLVSREVTLEPIVPKHNETHQASRGQRDQKSSLECRPEILFIKVLKASCSPLIDAVNRRKYYWPMRGRVPMFIRQVHQGTANVPRQRAKNGSFNCVHGSIDTLPTQISAAASVRLLPYPSAFASA